MPISINGTGSVTGITAGGLPDASVNAEDMNAGTAAAGQKLVASGATGAMTWGSSVVAGVAQASTSGTAIDFTGIPSWAKRVTVMFNGVSTNGTSNPLLQLGSGSVTTSGYVASGSNPTAAATTAATYTTGFGIVSANAANVIYGHFVLTNVSGNIWVCSSMFGFNGATMAGGGGAVTLSGALDRVRVTTVNGTDQFDAGSVNIFWE